MQDKPTLSRAALLNAIQDKLRDVPGFTDVKIGPIVERDAPGQWIVGLEGNYSGSCLRAFMNARSELQEQFDLQPHRRGWDE